jgi:4-alpha-glucanotransferase
MTFPRRSGVLLHPTSLPGPHGSGDLGAAAYHFVDWLQAARQSLWQVLPLNGIGPGNSPYMSPSAFAGNELLIGLVQLRDAGWLASNEVAPDPALPHARVDYPEVQAFRRVRLRRAAACFFAHPNDAQHRAFTEFCAQERDWLDDYALFMALSAPDAQGAPWQNWPAPLALREPEALRAVAAQRADETDFWKFCQWQFFTQWAALKAYANARGIAIVGDVPIFVAAHSADVWAHQPLFDLDADGHPHVVAGVPPDYFSATGQRWGNPLYRWSAHAAQGYRWWAARMRQTLSTCDIVRIDHFRGFDSYWEIAGDAATAIDGCWRSGPGAALFVALDEILGVAPGELPVIAEDLGDITPAVTEMRQALGLPGMRILQFAFDGQPDNHYLPHNFEVNTVVYTGTHDNDTTCGWWVALAAHERDYVRRYLGMVGDEIEAELKEIHWNLIRAASASVAAQFIVPMQDVLGLDSSQRMNRPGDGEGAWGWRFAWDQVSPWHAERLAELTRLYGRCA